MITLSIAIQIGGVDKSTTTLNQASDLVESGVQVVAIDLDPQATMTDACKV